jgi:hypothetical protein
MLPLGRASTGWAGTIEMHSRNDTRASQRQTEKYSPSCPGIISGQLQPDCIFCCLISATKNTNLAQQRAAPESAGLLHTYRAD